MPTPVWRADGWKKFIPDAERAKLQVEGLNTIDGILIADAWG
jgi:hypothetical protein